MANGIYHSHAYTVLGIYTTSKGDRILQFRNPHGRDSSNADG